MIYESQQIYQTHSFNDLEFKWKFLISIGSISLFIIIALIIFIILVLKDYLVLLILLYTTTPKS